MTNLSEKYLDSFKLEEMARLGKIDNIDVRVYTEPLGNPSVHLVTKKYEIVIELKNLYILEIKKNDKSKYKFKKNEELPSDIKKSVMSLLLSKHKGINLTMREYLLTLWNDNNPGFEIKDSYFNW